MTLKIKIEYIEVPDEAERIHRISKILAEGVYAYLKKEGLLRVNLERKEKVQEAMDTARGIISRDISG